MKDLVDTTEMYLRTIFELEEEGVVPLRARIAERLEQSGPTVSQTIARMERDGLVEVAADRHLELSAEGRAIATRVMRKHRLAERLLVDVIGLDLDKVHAEACRWEHVMSEDVERRLVEVLGEPTVSPYGNPIPGLDLLGADAREGATPATVRLHELEPDQSVEATVVAFGEVIQDDAPLLGTLTAAGVVLGARITATARRSGVDVVALPAGSQIRIDEAHAHAVQIEVEKK